jgi:hypothetical protein
MLAKRARQASRISPHGPTYGYPKGVAHRLASPGVAEGSERDQEMELARETESVWAQGMPILRAVEEQIAGKRVTDGESAARQISAALNLGITEVTAAVRKVVIVGPNQDVDARVVMEADLIVLSEGSSVTPLEDIDELSARASRDGIAGFSNTQVLALVLVWLLTIGAPVVQQALPPGAQTMLSDEYGTLGIAIALTLVILSRKH